MRSPLWSSLLLAALSVALAEGSAQACSGPARAEDSAVPASGAVDVSPMSSVFILSGQTHLPEGLTLTANGAAVPLPTVDDLGGGTFGGKYAHFWRLSSYLQPSATYTLSVAGTPASKTLTTFTTAASYDKPQGQAPVLTSLRLWRVHYPVEQVAAGGCVFSEYEGYIDVNYQDGSVPATPTEEVVGVVALTPRTGGVTQTFAFAGISHFEGAPLWDAAKQTTVDVPDGQLPSPVYSVWKPTLEPDREYCATITLYGRNDQAMLPVVSNQICAKVKNVDTTSTSGGCRLSGSRSGESSTAVFVIVGLVALRMRLRRR